MASQGPDVSTFLALLIVVTLVAAAVRWVRLPYEVALVAAGLVLALTPIAPHVPITPNVILTVFLPILLFDASYNLSLPELRSVLRLVSYLALPGVLVTAGLVGLMLHVLAGLSWSSALLFGTIVSATDPVSVLAIFGQVGAPRRLTAIVNGESLFNDGTALVLFAIVLSTATDGHFSLLGSAGELVVVILGSLVLGAAVGLLGAQVLRRVDDALLETAITLIMAYGGYLLATHLTLSGPLETVVAGLLLGTRGEQVMAPATRLQAGATWEFLDFMANSLVFLLMGLAVRAVAIAPGERLGDRLWGPLFVAVVAVMLARVVVVGLTHQVMALLQRPLPAGWGIVLTWAGLRGAVSLAAVLSLPSGLRDRDLLLALTFGIVIFTLVAQGLTIRPLLARLGLAADDADTQRPALLEEEGQPDTAGPETLDEVLRVLAREEALDEQALARHVGVPFEMLEYLRRCPRPDPLDDGFEAEVAGLALAFNGDREALERVLRSWWATGLIWPLRAYQRRHQLNDAELATYLGLPLQRLQRLYRQKRPDGTNEQYDDEVTSIAEACDCNRERLAHILREATRETERQPA